MAEEEGQERTEQASERKKEKLREKGEVPRSRDLTSTLEMLAVISFFFLFGSVTLAKTEIVFKDWFGRAAHPEISVQTLGSIAGDSMGALLSIMIPPVAIGLAIALIAHMVQTGFTFSGEPLVPKLERISPLQGFKRIFSVQTLAETVKGTLKVVVLAYILKGIVVSRIPTLADVVMMSMSDIAGVLFEAVWAITLAAVLAYLAFGAADYTFQKWNFERQNRMSKQEMREEHKEQEGDPLIRARVRTLQREMARKRMMAEVPKATVVLTNPTHLAIALMYTPEMSAPKVVAKGAGWLAERIKTVARENDVIVMEDKPLARALFKLDIGAEIPEELYKAVARVLAFVFGRKPMKAAGAQAARPAGAETSQMRGLGSR